MTLNNNMGLREIEEKVKHNVSFYWESDDSYPVLEVFRSDTKENILKDFNELERIIDSRVSVDYEKLGENYFRLMLVFSPNETIEYVVSLSETLKKYGSNIYEDK